MRNSLYPGRQARYVVGQELKQLLKSDAKVERDNQYLLQKPAETDPQSIQQQETLPHEAGKAIKLTSITVSIILPGCHIFNVLTVDSLNALQAFSERCYPQT
jgi:hypothetical protein